MNTYTDGLNHALSIIQQEQAHRGSGHALDALMSVEAAIKAAIEQKTPRKYFALRMNEPVEVDGTAVEFDGFAEFDFFVYREPDADMWWVCEVSTGLAVSLRCANRRSAITDADRQLNKAGIDKVRQCVADALKGFEVTA